MCTISFVKILHAIILWWTVSSVCIIVYISRLLYKVSGVFWWVDNLSVAANLRSRQLMSGWKSWSSSSELDREWLLWLYSVPNISPRNMDIDYGNHINPYSTEVTICIFQRALWGTSIGLILIVMYNHHHNHHFSLDVVSRKKQCDIIIFCIHNEGWWWWISSFFSPLPWWWT